ncbi:MAG: electron transport complex subunit RsxC [Candidatus Omnitrophota bacterium]|nr:electron transport complex subunit RsxC [Candidatus Omnitrophota bacterium]
MVKLKEQKDYTFNKSIKIATVPQKVFIPLSQHFGKQCIPVVKVKDTVLTGGLIATESSGIFSPIHSSVSGVVLDIQDYFHPLLGRHKAIVIESDGLDRCKTTPKRLQAEIENLTSDELRKIIFDAGIVGLGGAAFPTHIKLKPPKRIEYFILNGAECEPYLTNDFRLMVEHAKKILEGAEIVLKILGIDKCIVAIEDNKPEAIEIFKKEIRSRPFDKRRWEIRILKSQYPQGGEKQLIKSILNREVPSGGLPFDIGVVVQNVATVFAIYEAVYKNKPLYERVITATGSCIENPGNFLVRIGTTVRGLLNDCGPLKEEPAKIIFGGPMMGVAQFSLDVPIIKSTTGIIFFSKGEIINRENRVCCRCARCIDVCPARIMPAILGMAAEKERWDIAKDFDVFDCIECGLCSYICPAKRDLVHLIKYAKSRVKA